MTRTEIYEAKLKSLFLNFVYELRKDAGPVTLAEINKVPMEILQATFVAGGLRGITEYVKILQDEKP